MDACKLQLESAMNQKCKSIALCSRKLNSAQVDYTTTEREVETLKEFRNILLRATNQSVYIP